jgi:uncharacterized DUF497 family protein
MRGINRMDTITPMLAEASNSFTGQWFLVAIAALGGLVGVAGLFQMFATSREVVKLEERLDRAEEGRNQVIAEVGEIKGQLIAFNDTFEKFTRIIEATSSSRDETITTFTRALETFARVVDRNGHSR